MGAERRNHIRFLAQDNVIVALRNGNIKIGKVKDISKGGLSFEHIYEEDLSEEVSKKEIVLWAEELRISDIPCRAIYDVFIPTPDEIQSFNIHFKTRRCGMQFESLSEEQTAQLDLFLKTHTKERSS